MLAPSVPSFRIGKSRVDSQASALLQYRGNCSTSRLHRVQARSVQVVSAAQQQQQQQEPAWKHGMFGIEMQVRDYELDQFGVVNNAVYSSYLQHARHEAFSALGYDCDKFARTGTPLALSEIHIVFKAPLRAREHFRVVVSVDKVTAARVTMAQQIVLLPTDNNLPELVVCTAEAVVVFLDREYRPTRIPADIRKRFEALQQRFLGVEPSNQ